MSDLSKAQEQKVDTLTSALEAGPQTMASLLQLTGLRDPQEIWAVVGMARSSGKQVVSDRGPYAQYRLAEDDVDRLEYTTMRLKEVLARNLRDRASILEYVDDPDARAFLDLTYQQQEISIRLVMRLTDNRLATLKKARS